MNKKYVGWYKLLSVLCLAGSTYGVYTSFQRLEALPIIAFCLGIGISLAFLIASFQVKNNEKENKNENT